jgi:hypothetical protein
MLVLGKHLTQEIKEEMRKANTGPIVPAGITGVKTWSSAGLSKIIFGSCTVIGS